MLTMRTSIAGILLTLCAVFSAQVVHAAEVPSLDQVVLHLDEGFLGHPVKLDLFDGSVRIAWDAGDLLAPADLTVTRTSSTQFDLEWSSSYLLGPNGVSVGLRAPTSTSPFDVLAIEARKPFGTGHTQTSTVTKDGLVSARIGAEASVRLSTAPQGMRQGTATWYKYKKCDCAASPDFPKGTALLVRLADHPETNTIVRVNDFGPDRSLFPTRVIDLDSVAFKKLSPLSAGIIRVTVEPLAADDPRLQLAVH
jgi:hypothetical protein